MNKFTYVWVMLAIAAVFSIATASITYAWDTFTVNPRPVHADGAAVEKTDGYSMVTVTSGDTEYLVVTNYETYENESKEELKGVPRQFITVYEIARKSEGKAELIFIGSRCTEWDRGYELINFKQDKSSPEKLRGSR